jgi:hypothetical protein
METNFTPKTIAELGIKLTSIEGSYWNHNGAYQEDGDRLFEELVPASGAAATLNGELIRGINRLYYEYLNNGNCNACEVTHIGDHGWWDEETEDPDEIESVEIDAYYGKFLDLISTSLENRIVAREVQPLMSRVREIIENAAYDMPIRVYLSKENDNAYSRMCDLVIWYVLNTPDSELPADYDRN